VSAATPSPSNFPTELNNDEKGNSYTIKLHWLIRSQYIAIWAERKENKQITLPFCGL
jgi:hypothetical protein